MEPGIVVGVVGGLIAIAALMINWESFTAVGALKRGRRFYQAFLRFKVCAGLERDCESACLNRVLS